MRKLFALFAMFALAVSAASYSTGPMQVDSNLAVEENQRLSDATAAVVSTYVSYLTLEVKNTGPVALENIKITADLSPIEGILEFSPPASLVAPRTPMWELSTLAPGESRVLSAKLSGARAVELLSSIPAPTVSFSAQKVRLDAPQYAQVGERYTLILTSSSGPVPGAQITITSPSGKETMATTDQNGRASYFPQENGHYTYLVLDYPMESYPATVAQGEEIQLPPPTAGASIPQPGFELNIGGIVPIIFGLLLLAVVAFAVLSFGSQPREEPQASAQQQSYVQPSPQTQQGQPLNPEVTRSLLAQRRSEQQSEPQPAEPQEGMGEYTTIYEEEGEKGSEDGEKAGDDYEGGEKESEGEEGKGGRAGAGYGKGEGGDEYERAGEEKSAGKSEGDTREEEKESEGSGEAGYESGGEKPEAKSAAKKGGAKEEGKEGDELDEGALEQIEEELAGEPEEESGDWEEEQSSIQRQLELIRKKLASTRGEEDTGQMEEEREEHAMGAGPVIEKTPERVSKPLARYSAPQKAKGQKKHERKKTSKKRK